MAQESSPSRLAGVWAFWEAMRARRRAEARDPTRPTPAMRRLADSLDTELALAGVTGGASVMIAEAAEGEGASETAVSLAVCGASGGRRVLLIDGADGAAQAAFGIPADRPGLLDMMADGSNLSVQAAAVTTAFDNLLVLPIGGPGARLRPSALDRVLEEARASYDLVIVDSPPLPDAPQALLLAQKAGRVLLVVRKRRLSVNQLSHAVDEIRRAGADLIGCALNEGHQAPRTRRP